MEFERRSRRTDVDIPVTVTTVLDSVEAAIVDLSEHGAQIQGCSVPHGARVQIDYLGQTIFAQSRWTEVDRMGVEFLFPLSEGPLYQRLLVARVTPHGYEAPVDLPPAFTPLPQGPVTLAARTFSRAPIAGQFGRRN